MIDTNNKCFVTGCESVKNHKNKYLSFKKFKDGIRKIVCNKNGLYFAVMQDCYFADYKPKYPDKSEGDKKIYYNWIKGEGYICRPSGANDSTISLYREFDSFDELLEML